MSDETIIQQTQHAFLVAWGHFATEMGLIQAIKGIKLKQKKYRYKPQTKVLEFLVATLAGLKQLQEISLAAHPLDTAPSALPPPGLGLRLEYKRPYRPDDGPPTTIIAGR